MNFIERIDQNTEAFRTSFEKLSSEHLNWKPNPSQWSIAQNVEHLIIINESYFPIFDQLKAGKLKLPFTSKLGFLVSLFGKMVLQSVQPDQKRKTQTFPIWEPSKSEISGDILERFSAHQMKLKEEITSLQPFIENRTIIYSPANSRIVYYLATALDIIIAHEQRHLEQAKELLILHQT